MVNNNDGKSHLERRTFNNIPTVLLYEGQARAAAQKGCILCYHGLSSSTADWLHELEKIAQHGFLVVGVDSVGHGERCYPDFHERLSEHNPQFNLELLQVVTESAKEVPLLVDALTQEGLVQNERLGVLGVSMGGFIAYSSILQEPRLHAAATIVSSPEFWLLETPDSPHLHPERFGNIRLLSQTAGKDMSVPPAYSRAFHETLKTTYPDYAQRFGYIEYPEAGHFMDNTWNAAWAEAIAWFEQQL